MSFINTPIPGQSASPAVTDPSVPGLVGQRSKGVSLINGTQTITTFSVPNDGKPHWFLAQICEQITSATTGGQINVSGTVNGVPYNLQMLAGTQAAGTALTSQTCECDPGTLLKVSQATAMTAGAATLDVNINETTYGQ